MQECVARRTNRNTVACLCTCDQCVYCNNMLVTTCSWSLLRLTTFTYKLPPHPKGCTREVWRMKTWLRLCICIIFFIMCALLSRNGGLIVHTCTVGEERDCVPLYPPTHFDPIIIVQLVGKGSSRLKIYRCEASFCFYLGVYACIVQSLYSLYINDSAKYYIL